MVAVSQAPSPESNPDPPLSVNAIVGLYPTILVDKAEIGRNSHQSVLSLGSPGSSISAAIAGVGFCVGELHSS